METEDMLAGLLGLDGLWCGRGRQEVEGRRAVELVPISSASASAEPPSPRLVSLVDTI